MEAVASLEFFLRKFKNLNKKEHFIEDYLKIVEFIEWLNDFYPEKQCFLKNKFTFLVNF